MTCTAIRFGALVTATALAACSGGASSVGGPSGSSWSARMPASAQTPAAGIAKLALSVVDPAKIFVAGISSGGFFAVQMHIAYSSVFKGAAIYAGGVYHCAQDSVGLALAECGGETVNGQALYQSTLPQSETYLDQQSAIGTIDSRFNLRSQPVYLWSGTRDSVVNPREMADLSSEYQYYGARVVFDNSFPADHGWESLDGEVACSTPAASPYMITCLGGTQPYDSEKTWLSLFFGNLNARNSGALGGRLIRFDQTEFGASASNSMDGTGVEFVPAACAAGRTCGFVLALHGCLQGQAQIGDTFVTESGLDEWADSNGIIVLYPYAVESSTSPLNPKGCWDWWGYDDPNYATKAGTQMSIVYKMVQRVTGSP